MTLFPCKIIIKKHMENNMCYECPASNIEKKLEVFTSSLFSTGKQIYL